MHFFVCLLVTFVTSELCILMYSKVSGSFPGIGAPKENKNLKTGVGNSALSSENPSPLLSIGH